MGRIGAGGNRDQTHLAGQAGGWCGKYFIPFGLYSLLQQAPRYIVLQFWISDMRIE